MPGIAGHFAFHIYPICHAFIFRYLKKIAEYGKRMIRKLSSNIQKHRKNAFFMMLFLWHVRFRVQ